jgi:type IV secretion system protein VirD4
MENSNGLFILLALVFGFIIITAFISSFGKRYSLNSIKNRSVGHGQHGTARFATKAEVKELYQQIPFEPQKWRNGQSLPDAQGIIVGSATRLGKTTAYVDCDDVHALVSGAAGTGKTAFFLYPNLEYCCASGMSFLTTDTKGDLYRNYAPIAKEKYGYNIAVIELRNPTRSDEINLLHLVNYYMDQALEHPDDLSLRARAEKYAKIVSKTIMASDSERGTAKYGQNAFFYESAEGLITSTILLIAEFAPKETRHIISVFKLLQELLAPSGKKDKNKFQVLLDTLPPEHKARWFAGAALNSPQQQMLSVISTALSRLNSFLDTEMEQILCFDTAINAEKFCAEKSAIFIVMPEEDASKYFLVSLIVQQLYREILSIADEHGGKLKNRVMMYLDEFGTISKIENAEMMFSASRSRRISVIPIIQSAAQLEEKYDREGAKIIVDNCQLAMYCGFAPMSEDADIVSKRLGSKTVLSGSVSQGRNASQSLQMIERPLMTGDELRTLPKGSMLVTKTGAHPVITQMQLYTKWGITFGSEPYILQDKSARPVKYVSEQDIAVSIISKNRRDIKKAIIPAPPQFHSEVADKTKAPEQQPSVKSPQKPLHNQSTNPLRTD